MMKKDTPKSCLICYKKNVKLIHHFDFIDLFQCPSCKTIFAGQNRHKIRTEDWGEEKSEIASYYDYQFRFKNKVYLDILEKNIKNNGGILVDIGCGPGSFLAAAKKRGWRILGIEPSKQLCLFAKEKYGLKLINDEFKLKYIKNQKCAVITAFDVLEHLEDPKKFIKDLKPVLRQGGYLMLTVPNYSSFTIKLGIISFYASLNKILAPVKMITQAEYNYYHRYYFTSDTLKNLLQISGFRQIYTGTLSTVYADYFFQRQEFSRLPAPFKRLFSLLLQILQNTEGYLRNRDTLVSIATFSPN